MHLIRNARSELAHLVHAQLGQRGVHAIWLARPSSQSSTRPPPCLKTLFAVGGPRRTRQPSGGAGTARPVRSSSRNRLSLDVLVNAGDPGWSSATMPRGASPEKRLWAMRAPDTGAGWSTPNAPRYNAAQTVCVV